MKEEGLVAVYSFERFRFEADDPEQPDHLIAVVLDASEDEATVKGDEIEGGFQSGQAYRFFGEWSEYRDRRSGKTLRQYHFSSACLSEPIERHGVISYLQKADGIGDAKAREIWKAFGQDSLKEMREGDVDAIREATGMGRQVILNAREFFINNVRLERATIDVLNLLAGLGLPKKTTKRALDKWGIEAASIIKRNPYRLMEFAGIGFARCDKLYLHFGLPPDSLRRQALCAWYGIAREHSSGGHTWVPEVEAIETLKAQVKGTRLRIRDAIRLAIRGGILDAIYTDGPNGQIDELCGETRWLADRRKSRAERRLARFIAEAMLDKRDVDISSPVHGLSDHQQEKVQELFRQPGCLLILGGGPGTGKSYTTAKIVQHLHKSGIHPSIIAIAAPTGKAAVRITEEMAKQKVHARATTWHSLLSVVPRQTGGFHFEHGEEYPFEEAVIIGDEQSMQDTTMCCNSFAARDKGAIILLVGDINQLTPVGHGAPLRDMIKAGVPYVELTEIKRQEEPGEIVVQCENIRNNGRIEFSNKLDSNLQLVYAPTPELQIKEMLKVIDRLGTDFDPVSDIQVLVPTNKSGDLGRKNLNQVLQKHLNDAPKVAGSKFRLGDKVVQLENTWMKVLEHDDQAIIRAKESKVTGSIRKTAYTANGEVGIVTSQSNDPKVKKMQFELQAPFRRVELFRGKIKDEDDDEQNDTDAESKHDSRPNTGCSWDLAWALSCHKLQGSESPVVIVILDDSGGARRLCDRAWLYTGISRAKQLCICIGKESTAQNMVSWSKIDDRKTFLAELIQIEYEELMRQRAASVKFIPSAGEPVGETQNEVMEV